MGIREQPIINLLRDNMLDLRMSFGDETTAPKVNGINSYRGLRTFRVPLPLSQPCDDYEALLP